MSPSYLTWPHPHHPQLNMRIMGSQFVHSHHHLHSYSCSCSKCEQWYFWSSLFLTFRYCLNFAFNNKCKYIVLAPDLLLFCPSFQCVEHIPFSRIASGCGCAQCCAVCPSLLSHLPCNAYFCRAKYFVSKCWRDGVFSGALCWATPRHLFMLLVMRHLLF